MIECFTTNEQGAFQRSELSFWQNDRAEMRLLKVYPTKQHQQIIGFGAALTEASAYVFAQMTPETQDEFLRLCFSAGPEGNAYNLCRTHIQSCDFSLGSYAYMKKAEASRRRPTGAL